jgi:glycosyltransferase involved in cell wall biosynthesis
MKILMVNNTYKQIGGAEVYVNSLSDILIDKGHNVYHFAIDEDIELINQKNFVYKYKYKENIFKDVLFYYFNPSLFFRFKKWLKNVNPDIIHIHNNGKFGLTILLVIYLSHIPAIQTIHDYTILCPTSLYVLKSEKVCNKKFGICCPKNGCISWIRYFAELFPNYIKQNFQKYVIILFIVPSKALFAALTEDNYQNKCVYLPNFIKSPVNNLSIIKPKNESIVLFVGRLVKEKGILTFIDSISLILKKKPDCIFFIIGDGPLKQQIIERCMKNDLKNNVKILGRVSDKNLKEYYYKASLLVLPSIWIENNPLTALEGMAFGLPIIASNRGGFLELIKNGENGFLIEPGNSTILAETTLKVLNDELLSNKMRKNAIEKSKQYVDFEEHYNKINNLYLSIVNN